MSQYPPPSLPPSPPTGYATPLGYAYAYAQPDPLAPAKRAGIAMIVVGGLCLLAGLCCGAMGAMFEQIIAQQPEIMADMPSEISPEFLQATFIVMGVIVLGYGVGLIVSGVFARRGTAGPVITAICLTSAGILGLLVFALLGSIQASGGDLAINFCVVGVAGAVLCVPLVMLIFAMRAVPQVRQMQAQYQAMYWQYQYNQQAYQQQADNTGQPPPPPPV
jgi:hypothetical protein